MLILDLLTKKIDGCLRKSVKKHNVYALTRKILIKIYCVLEFVIVFILDILKLLRGSYYMCSVGKKPRPTALGQVPPFYMMTY